MPSTRISMCLICACETGTNTELSKNSNASFLVVIVLPSFEMKPKLTGNSETDVAADGHERAARRMRNVPVHAEPHVHSRTHAHVGRDTGEQHVAAAPALGDCRDAVILRVQPSHHWPDEPFAGPVLRFIRPVRKPEARLEVAAQAGLLRPLRAQQGMKILVGHKPPEMEEPGVSPIRCHEEIARARTGLQTRRQSFSVHVR